MKRNQEWLRNKQSGSRRLRSTMLTVIVLLVVLLFAMLVTLLTVWKELNPFSDMETQLEKGHLPQESAAEEILQQEAAGQESSISVYIEETAPEQPDMTEVSESAVDLSEMKESPSGTLVDVTGLSETEIQEFFYSSEIDPESELYARIRGVSYQEDGKISLEQLRYVRVLYFGFDGETHTGELIVNREIETEVLEIFAELYRAQYPIQRMELVDTYEGDDERSMEANNTSAFNYRRVSGTSRLSEHSYGQAIDLNPLYNPYVYTDKKGELQCEPKGGAAYRNRSEEFAHKIDHEDLAYQLFTAHGFSWGGDWSTRKDYQHFEKSR